MKYLARSKGRTHDVQKYTDHVFGTTKFVESFVTELIPYVTHLSMSDFHNSLINAALFHDLGKLDILNQNVLKGTTKGGLPVLHDDAGAAYWLNNETPSFMIAVLIYCHHKGLVNFTDEISKDKYAFRSIDTHTKYGCSRTDINLKTYLKIHSNLIGDPKLGHTLNILTNMVDWRIALSILIDADHSDSAKHCNQYFDYVLPEIPKWNERLEKLDGIIKNKGATQTNITEMARNKLRAEMYDYCRNSDITDSIVQCDASVGSGKTSAVLAFLLHKAVQAKETPRRLFIVVPFTNLICQIIDSLRSWVVLPNENANEVVVGHYHTADYKSDALKHLAVLWRARIIVTTAVQFFETLTATKTTSLRKLHTLPGSMVFIDEFDAAIPIKLWPAAWRHIKVLANNWGCNFVLSSGSSIDVWNLNKNKKHSIKSMVPNNLNTKLIELERKRINYKLIKNPLDIIKLGNIVKEYGAWPKLVVMNTTQNAAIFTQWLNTKKDFDVMHLSTVFTPKHRRKIINKINSRLKNQRDKKWILVATSCIESGMDFSFRTGFREAFSISSVLQLGGRINRNFMYEDGVLYVFTTTGPEFNKHPNTNSHAVIESLNARWFQTKTPSVLASESMYSYWNNNVDINEVNKLATYEKQYDFKDFSNSFKIIDSDTRTILISDSIKWKIEHGYNVKWQEIQENSVQLWSNKIEQLKLSKIQKTDIYYIQEDLYDPKLYGIMKYILQLKNMDISGCNII